MNSQRPRASGARGAADRSLGNGPPLGMGPPSPALHGRVFGLSFSTSSHRPPTQERATGQDDRPSDDLPADGLLERATGDGVAAAESGGGGGWRGRGVLARVGTALACLLVLFVLVVPDDPSRLAPGAFVRIPLEGLLGVALLLVPAGQGASGGRGARRRGPRPAGHPEDRRHGLLRRSRPAVQPGARLDPVRRRALELPHRRRSAGPARSARWSRSALLAVALLVLMTLSVLRLARLVVRHHTAATGAVAVLGVAWVACAPARRADRPAACRSRPRPTLAYDRTGQVRASLRDQKTFAAQVGVDAVPRHSRRPAAHRAARQGRPRSPSWRATDATRSRTRVRARRSTRCSTPGPAGCARPGSPPAAATSPPRRSAAAAGWRTPRCSPACGSTTSSATDTLVASDRLTLNGAFQPSGLAVRSASMPGNHPGLAGGRVLRLRPGLRRRRTSATGARASTTRTMPDQYTLSAFQRLERTAPDHAPVMAEITAGLQPLALDADPEDGRLGPGRRRLGLRSTRPPGRRAAGRRCGGNADQVRAAYRQSIEYSLNSPDLLRGEATATRTWCWSSSATTSRRRSSPAPGASRDVPITIVAQRPGRAGPDLRLGLAGRPAPGREAPVWRMDTFRDRFLTAFGPHARPTASPAQASP